MPEKNCKQKVQCADPIFLSVHIEHKEDYNNYLFVSHHCGFIEFLSLFCVILLALFLIVTAVLLRLGLLNNNDDCIFGLKFELVRMQGTLPHAKVSVSA